VASWFEGFFETDDWLAVALARPAERTAAEVEFLVRQLPAGARVLDVPCGTGRHAVALAERGYAVAGLDISERVLEVARAGAPEADFRQGDMRELPWADESFDAVLNLWTAFGYFETQEEDERVLREAARVLAPGGRLVIETINQAGLFRTFRPRSWSEDEAGTLLLEEVDHDLTTGRSSARWTFVRPDGSRSELAFDHRLYSPAEYGDMLRRAGLRPVSFLGDIDESALTLESRRLVVVAERTA
jgi:SAM-dependent methyltransferase